MDERQALSALAAMAQEHRLRIVRHLVTAGPDGIAAGVLADAVGVSTSNVSFHLKELDAADLITSRREGRSIIYSAVYPTLSGLLGFLMRDCCQGHPEICRKPVAALAACDRPTARA